jgi:tRNA(adenine34) deaminase
MSADIEFMKIALQEACKGQAAGEVPVGAVVVVGGVVLAREHNSSIGLGDPSAHAEILALRQAAAAAGNYRLPQATVYVTLEPCLMCAGALLQARIARLVFGARDPKAGAIVSLYRVAEDARLNHRFDFTEGILEDACAYLLKEFFRGRRIKDN